MVEQPTGDAGSGGAGAEAGPADEGGDETITADKNEHEEGGLSRRQVLAGGGALGLAGALGAFLAVDGPTERANLLTDADGESAADIAYSNWGRLREALKGSPDHLRGTANTLVAESDAKAIFEFVRDGIITQPPRIGHNSRFTSRVYGSPRATLRAGMGTPREKADLLAHLLERVGYQTRLYRYNRGLSTERLKNLYFSSPDNDFDPDIELDELKGIRRDMGVEDDQVPEMQPVDVDGAQSAALAERLRSSHPDLAAGARKFRWNRGAGGVPVVAFWGDPDESDADADGTGTGTETATETATPTPTPTPTPAGTPPESELRYADLFHADEAFGLLKEPDKLEAIEEAQSDSITVRLEAAMADSPNSRTELLSKTWDSRNLAGRQLLLKFLPGVSPFDHPQTRFTDVTRFIPSMTVQDPHAEKTELQTLTAMGDPFTPGGDRYEIEPDGTVKRNGRVVLEGNQPGTTFSLDPAATYLRTNGDENAKDATPIALSAADVEPGETITIEATGDYTNGPRGVVAVFSSSDRLLDDQQTHRVPGAIGVGSTHRTPTTSRWDKQTDIPEDFLVASGDGSQSSVTLDVPEGATHLFVSTADTFFGDNTDEDGDFGVRIIRQIEGDTAKPTDAEPPEAASKVTDIEAEATVGGFPQVKVKANALDGNGEPVEGLPGRAFTLTEEGEEVNAQMTANTSAPRVKMIFDGSLSVILSGFYENDNRERFRSRLESELKDLEPNAEIEFEQVGSNSWKHLAEASLEDPNLIVYLSDGDGYGSSGKTPERVTAIEEGPPAVMLTVTDGVYDTQQEMADLSGGTAIATNDESKTRAAFKEYVSELQPELESYSFQYRTPKPDAEGLRTVKIDLDGTDASARATYEVPENSIDPRSKKGIVGLYLTVDSRGGTSRRTIAGYNNKVHDREPNEADRNEVMGALFGEHILQFETAGVPITTKLEDSIAGKQTLRPLQKAREAGDRDRIESAVREGVTAVSPHPHRFHPTLPDRVTADSLTYSAGLRTVLFSQRPVFGEAKLQQSVDVLSTAQTRTITREQDRTREFSLTMDRTARLAVLEREIMDRSTASLLADATLAPSGEAVSNWDGEMQTRFNNARNWRATNRSSYQLVAESGTTAAFWNVNGETGAVTGVLPDGSGGGDAVENIKETVKLTTQMAVWWNSLLTSGAVATPGGAALGAVALYYGILLSKLYAIATVSLATTTAGDIKEDAKAAITNFVCNLALELAIGLASKGAGTAGKAAGASGYKKAGEAADAISDALGLANFMNNLHAGSTGTFAFGCGLGPSLGDGGDGGSDGGGSGS